MTMLRSQLLFPCAVGIHRRCYAPPPRLSCPLPTLPRSLQAVQVACCSCTHDLGGGGGLPSEMRWLHETEPRAGGMRRRNRRLLAAATRHDGGAFV